MEGLSWHVISIGANCQSSGDTWNKNDKNATVIEEYVDPIWFEWARPTFWIFCCSDSLYNIAQVAYSLGVGFLSQFPLFRYFPKVSTLSKDTLYIENHVYIWQVSTQLSCGDTCQIWMWFKECNGYFCKIENIAYAEINERSFSNTHPRSNRMGWLEPKPRILMLIWHATLGLLSRSPVMLWSPVCNSFEDRPPVDEIYGCPIFKWFS